MLGLAVILGGFVAACLAALGWVLVAAAVLARRRKSSVGAEYERLMARDAVAGWFLGAGVVTVVVVGALLATAFDG